MTLLESLRQRAARLSKHIVLPEGEDPRTLRAAVMCQEQGIARVTLLGEAARIREQCQALGIDPDRFPIIEPATAPEYEFFAQAFYEHRKAKGLSLEQAREALRDPLYFGNMMVRMGYADGSVAGATHSTAKTVRAALQVIGLAPGFNIVSSFMLITVQDRRFGANGNFLFADCAIVIEPSAAELTDIALATAENCRTLLGVEPKVAMLSFSTRRSAEHPLVDKVATAVRMVAMRQPDLLVDGEMQADAAIVPVVGARKAPGSPVAGYANVLIFPSLEAANIAYKLVERLGQATAIGPILQGLAKPANDLSRGCEASDIVDAIAITALQASQGTASEVSSAEAPTTN